MIFNRSRLKNNLSEFRRNWIDVSEEVVKMQTVKMQTVQNGPKMVKKAQNGGFTVAPPSSRFDCNFKDMFQVDMWAYGRSLVSIGLKLMELWLFISRAPPLLCSLANSFRGEQYFTNLLIGIEQVGVLMLARKFGANRMYAVGEVC